MDWGTLLSVLTGALLTLGSTYLLEKTRRRWATTDREAEHERERLNWWRDQRLIAYRDVAAVSAQAVSPATVTRDLDDQVRLQLAYHPRLVRRRRRAPGGRRP